ncbi:DUF1883 domain-containing protein [Amycolatopsis sp. ATCC 39116]|uniref:DUF1883 domain-containing protein n=1 Tax=Amycolatopsis sp. (strain ATCC 39116 / 75iv2) TaxID=385957 RepID=UPI0002627625|nr:DUF1883 domain-containing protein [Amycolatopsis sp. ATCC 39116]
MEHVKYDLGQLRKGSVVIVTLKNQANVLLMDASNYRSYTRGQRARYYGGLMRRSPARIPVPHDGHWFVALDLGGAAGRIASSVSVQPPPRGNLPPMRESGSLSAIQHNAPDIAPAASPLGGQTWDVFISHASEDKDAVARPLAEALRELGVTVWLDEIQLRIGDSLRRKIDQGIRASKFATVIFSSEFMSKGWTQYELDGIVTKTVVGEQNLLPIWHNVSKDEIMSYSPSLADKVARSTSTSTIAEIAVEIAAVVKENHH